MSNMNNQKGYDLQRKIERHNMIEELERQKLESFKDKTLRTLDKYNTKSPNLVYQYNKHVPLERGYEVHNLSLN